MPLSPRVPDLGALELLLAVSRTGSSRSAGQHAHRRRSVGFCDPWPRGWGLLGQLSFFRYHVVTLRAGDFELEVEPIAH